VDYLWGRPTEVLMRTLTPESFAFPKPTRTMGGLYGRIVEWTRSGELTFEVEKFPLRDIETPGSGQICGAGASSPYRRPARRAADRRQAVLTTVPAPSSAATSSAGAVVSVTRVCTSAEGPT